MPDSSPIFDALNSRDYDENVIQRIFHGRGHVFPGLDFITVDWYPPALFVCVFRPVEQKWLDNLLEQMWHSRPEQASVLVLQQRQGASTVSKVIEGELPQPHVVTEAFQNPYDSIQDTHDLIEDIHDSIQDTHDDKHGNSSFQFYVQLNNSQNVGIFPDMINGRAWVKAHCKHKNVLNLFAYTCVFSIAALQGGASQVINVDMNKSVMAMGRKNHLLNAADMKRVKFFTHNIFNSWGKIKRYGAYDLIIIDPPSFQKGSFVLTKDYQRLIKRLPELASDGADVLLCLNSPEVGSQYIFDLVGQHCPQLTFVKRIDSHSNFAEIDPEKSLKVLLFSFNADTNQ